MIKNYSAIPNIRDCLLVAANAALSKGMIDIFLKFVNGFSALFRF
jgi:hypothetical protein